MAMELFGKAGTKLLPLMADGAAGINEMQEQARKLGLTVSTETARDAAELNDALGTLWKVLKQGVFTIGGALAPTIKDLTERITRIVVSATAWVKANKETVVWALKVAAAVAVAGIAIVGLGYIISGIGAALGIVAAVIGGIGTAFSLIGAAIGAILTPVGLTIAAIVALGGTLLVVTGAGSEALSWLAHGDRFAAGEVEVLDARRAVRVEQHPPQGEGGRVIVRVEFEHLAARPHGGGIAGQIDVRAEQRPLRLRRASPERGRQRARPDVLPTCESSVAGTATRPG